eukprot:TRINITY_DN4686_c0_g1_i2.p1 TRINITY_DN4686_c0_g1~~TRINITY_DN4686_c0_g1_i2.p1  ORF type:complete len:925 (+),score=138.25 TRINITY_DN4686_c0_g1_i2:37-2811(+)
MVKLFDKLGIEFFDESVPLLWRRIAIGVVIGWLVLTIPMAVFAPKLINATSMDFVPPSGSESAKAATAMNDYFPSVQSSSQVALYVEAKGDGIVYPNNELVANYTQEVIDSIITYNKTHPGKWPSVIEARVISAYKLYGYDIDPDLIAPHIVSKSGRSTIILIMFTDPTGKTGLSMTSGTFLQDYATQLRNHVVHDLKNSTNVYTVRATGITMVGIDGLNGAISDIEHSDMIIMPIAFLIFTYYVRSLRLLLLPLITLGLSIGTAFAVVYPVAEYSAMEFFTVTPNTMMSCCLALCLDYNLFILMRFRESMDLNFSVFHTIKTIVNYTCLHTIIISGSLITLAWFGMLLIPAQPIQSQGLGAGLAVFCVVLVNCTITPAILTIFPSFFRKKTTFLTPLLEKMSSLWASAKKKCGCGKRDYVRIQGEDGEESDVEINTQQPKVERVSSDIVGTKYDVLSAEKVEVQNKDLWFRIANFVERYSWGVILVVIAAGAPCYVQLPKVETNLDFFEFSPRNAPSVTAWRDMAADFSAGAFLPYFVLITTKNPAGLNSSAGYAALDDFVELVVNDTNLGGYPNPRTYIEGVSQIPVKTGCYNGNISEWNGQVTWDYLYNNETGLFSGTWEHKWVQGYCQLIVQTIIDNQFAPSRSHQGSKSEGTVLLIYTPYQPTGQNSTNLMKELDAVMKKFSHSYPDTEIYLSGGNTICRDFNKIIDDSTPIMLGSILGFVSIVILIAFRSLVLPFRMALTIGYTVATTFGFSYYVYQTDSFHWLFPYLEDFGNEGLQWMAPSMAVAITVALGMDYDVFLLTRIYEYRIQHCYQTNAAIVKGLSKTGPIITGAGVIMTIAFAGLISSNVVGLNQLGLLLCFSVLCDTFVVRSLFVPATMFILKEYNWFWRRVPEGIYTKNDFADESPEAIGARDLDDGF